jgi:hypothetical protein
MISKTLNAIRTNSENGDNIGNINASNIKNTI